MSAQLKSLGITTVAELIDYVPRRYEDYSVLTPINKLRPGNITIKAKVSNVKGRYVRRGMHVTEAIASDETGSVRLVWFNQPYRAKHLKPAVDYFISGDYSLRRSRFSILNPSVELVSDFPVNTARIIPIYRLKKDIKSHTLRKLVREALNKNPDLDEHLPQWLIEANQLVSYSDAVAQMHFPSSSKTLEAAKKRLAFEEVFELSLAALLNKNELSRESTISVEFNEKLAKQFVASLPFALTDAQRKAVWQIFQDLERSNPMNRLLEGDVGSGKTVVAAMATLMTIASGYQVALMAPTEILAAQHFNSLKQLLADFIKPHELELLVGSLSVKQKALMQANVKNGKTRLIIGTHALIADKLKLNNLGLVIIDEQHRFGVEQRKKLQAKAGHMPHVLSLSATPIPRSLALTLYGELDITVLDELPPGRQPVKTEIVPPNSKRQMFQKIDDEITDGRQVFVICPLITDTDTNSYTGSSLSAEKVFDSLSQSQFKHRRLALLHGRMKSSEKDKIMSQFKGGEYDILVSTTVIEVGVDIPNASVMVVEGAERFGLAQLHQLRGRVGRGEHDSICYLVTSDSKGPTSRLRALQSTNDGFKLAEIDLQLRGPGAIYGNVQHGVLDLRVAKLTDTKLIAAARAAAQHFIISAEKLESYSYLSSRVNSLRAVTNLN